MPMIQMMCFSWIQILYEIPIYNLKKTRIIIYNMNKRIKYFFKRFKINIITKKGIKSCTRSLLEFQKKYKLPNEIPG